MVLVSMQHIDPLETQCCKLNKKNIQKINFKKRDLAEKNNQIQERLFDQQLHGAYWKLSISGSPMLFKSMHYWSKRKRRKMLLVGPLGEK